MSDNGDNHAAASLADGDAAVPDQDAVDAGEQPAGAAAAAAPAPSEQLLLTQTLASLHRMLEERLAVSSPLAPNSSPPAKPDIRLRPPIAYQPKMNFDTWEAQLTSYLATCRVPEDQKSAILVSLLSAECQEVYLNYRCDQLPFESALRLLRERYTDAKKKDKAYVELVAAAQSHNEQMSDFFDRLVSYSRLAGLSLAEAKPLLKARFCHGLRDKDLAEKLLLWDQETDSATSAEELMQKAKDLVGVRQLLNVPPTIAKVRAIEPDAEKKALEQRVAELEKMVTDQANRLSQTTPPVTTNQGPARTEPTGGPPQVSQTYRQPRPAPRPPRACHRCGQTDHLIADCPSPSPRPQSPKQPRGSQNQQPSRGKVTTELGTIATWSQNYGFIQSEHLPEKLFVHISQLSPSLRSLVEQHRLRGTRVKFQRQVDPGRQHDKACNVQPQPGDSDPQCRQGGYTADTFESSYFVQLGVGDSKVLACLDSGANASIMGADVKAKLVAADPVNNIFTPSANKQRATAFGGSQVDILGSLRCEINLGNTTKQHVFLVTAYCTTEALLGMDFLRSFEMLLDFNSGRALVAGVSVPVIEGDKGIFQLRRVMAAGTVELPPHSETLIPSRVLDSSPYTSGIVMSRILGPETEQLVAKTLDSVSDTNHILVRVLNSGEQPIQITRGQEIASFQELDSHEVIAQTTLKESDFSLDNVANLTSQLSKLPPPSRELAKWLTTQFQLDQAKLSRGQLATVLKLLNYFNSQISRSNADLGHTNLHEMGIELIDPKAKPVAQPYRRTTPAQKEFLDQNIAQMLEQGVIEECDSDWVSPIVLVKKKDGTQRLCIDYRAVNKLIKPCSFPLPLIEESFDSLAGATVFSSLDLTSAYWQVGIKEEARDYTAFACPQGTFRWKVVPFGIKTAPANFAKLMHKVFRPLLMKVSLIYLDDIIIKAVNNDQMIAHLALVLWQLRKAGLKIKPSKCELFKDKVAFLGFVVSSRGIEADPAKTQAVQDWPKPLSKKQLLSFLGFANYYRKFVPRFSIIATPLYALAKKDAPFLWQPHHERAFQELKHSLCSPPILAYPDLSAKGREFILDCDSSLDGTGGVLYQLGPDGQEQVIAYASKKFNSSQRNYCATMRELLGLVLMLEHFRPYLLDKPFTVRVDAAALKWLHSKKHATGMLAQWLATIELYPLKVQQSTLERIAEYDFTVQYRPGVDHVPADALSRLPKFRADHFDCPTCSQIPEFKGKFLDQDPKHRRTPPSRELRQVCVQTIGISVACQTDTDAPAEPTPNVRATASGAVPSPETESRQPDTESQVPPELIWAQNAQDSCVDMARLIASVQCKTEPLSKAELQGCSREMRALWAQFNDLEVVEGLLYLAKSSKAKTANRRLVVPETADVGHLVLQYHGQLNHCGITKTMAALKARFVISDLDTIVKGVLAECTVCAKTKKSKRKLKAPMQPELSGYPNQVVHVDHAGPFEECDGYKYLLVMIDRFTGFVEVVPVPDVSAETTATTILTEWVARYGVMEQLVSDNGTAFINSTMIELTRLLQIDMGRITARRPQANGKAERMIQTVKAQIRAICLERQCDWPLASRLAALSIRATVAESTGFTPAKLFFGREFELPLDLCHNPPPNEHYQPERYAHQLHRTLVETSALARRTRGKAQERQKRYYDRRALRAEFHEGELVWVLNPNHKGIEPAVWLGPYRVVQRCSERTYRLVPEYGLLNPADRVPNPRHNIYNIDRLKPCIRQPTYQDVVDRYGEATHARSPAPSVNPPSGPASELSLVTIPQPSSARPESPRRAPGPNPPPPASGAFEEGAGAEAGEGQPFAEAGDAVAIEGQPQPDTDTDSTDTDTSHSQDSSESLYTASLGDPSSEQLEPPEIAANPVAAQAAEPPAPADVPRSRYGRPIRPPVRYRTCQVSDLLQQWGSRH
ncbi:hypothetical protein BOX15_Mlig033625g1 [Macrostomum lignano]|uniref:Reverse transcriptase n=1 Tax=Macrostomum lignano TaxID=282301 RepID=A0A267F866_9PLAT|nr:hypothetical protein BOX15_Mlig033625g1 [Macrostomum lignano]